MNEYGIVCVLLCHSPIPPDLTCLRTLDLGDALSVFQSTKDIQRLTDLGSNGLKLHTLGMSSDNGFIEVIAILCFTYIVLKVTILRLFTTTMLTLFRNNFN
uniref:Uncharacterized protein n=1 Tax=Cacopsylla melanoneura TaxID=428564 RepID=A0A8D8RQW6_9HEMI